MVNKEMKGIVSKKCFSKKEKNGNKKISKSLEKFFLEEKKENDKKFKK